ncbi:motility associated factor glycosyltransferase family protein [Pseudoalteromonas sp. MMG013]|uniref:motility associated factor glycosyltransferase family protein n=1 Tax=Pseudoalteromonas sp. MMG013 TaxID=2822687 RepID=UPI001B36398D|nr:6-hydroxymethylpterin diphosphokinase MptE-like protein [Pseudoalteromonas sp. MMG013]MBQ4863800.1 motility associated factor glycosyltransferase family protein [Pseudoalteromonas sp. MMG013]
MDLIGKNREFLRTQRNVELSPSWNNAYPSRYIDASIIEFYGTDPKTCCEQQVNLFLKHPQHLSLQWDVMHNTPKSKKPSHQCFIDNSSKFAHTLGYKSRSKPNRGTLVILGLSAGFHINLLLNAIPYSDVIIIEPNELHLAMACAKCDFNLLNSICLSRGGSFTVSNANSYQHFLRFMTDTLNVQGHHLLADISVYRHRSEAAIDEIYDNFRQWRNRFTSMWGFVEDELIGLEHTIENAQKVPFQSYNGLLENKHKASVIIVGNGPSLDNDIDYLYELQSQVIIVSCGTALSTLLRKGITPDIHVEMERTAASYYLKENDLKDPCLRETIFLGLNTVYPKFIDTFNYIALLPKANDIGGEVLCNKIKQLHALYHCNPTVSNMAVAALAHMGINQLVLLGCDFGYINPAHHHSKSSIYYETDNILSSLTFKSELQVTGNFKDSIFTSRILNESRQALETLIKSSSSLQLINCSDGALISGSESIKLKNVTLSNTPKTQILNHIKSTAKMPPTGKIHVEEVLSPAEIFLKKLHHDIQSVQCVLELLNLLSTFNVELKASRDLKTYPLLSGSIKYTTLTIASHINHLPPSQWPEYKRFINIELKKLIIMLLEKLTNKPKIC